MTVSIMFRLINIVFLNLSPSSPPGIGNTPTHKLEAHSKIAKLRLQQRPAWYDKRTAFFFYWWATCRCMRVPSQVCCGKVALQRARLRVGACTDRQTVEPLPPPTCVVSSSAFCLVATNPQTEEPRPSSLPCQKYDGAHSVYHTQRCALRHCIPVALEMCFTCKQRSFRSLHWPSSA